jgi:eukaryotic-like serine/threonine-protein kinase
MSSPSSAITNENDGASRVGQVVSGRYRIQQLLGEGGMGAVYLAEHTHMKKRVALKLLHPEMSENAEVQARFEREAMAAAHIEHPNVAAATDFGKTEDGALFLVLEYIEGTSLRDVIDGRPLEVARAVHIVRQIALALERAHTEQIVHRDLKPENVMLVRRADDPDFVKVLDFGIAKMAPAQRADGGAPQPLTRIGTIMGTPEYMAPEQALGEAVTPQADLYALGIMLYEMLTGVHPFDPPDRMAMLSFHIVAPVPLMADRVAGLTIPPAIEGVVRTLLEKDAKARPASARALVSALDAACVASGVEVRGAPMLRESLAHLPVAPPSLPSASWSDGDSFAKTSFGEVAVPTPAAMDVARAGTQIAAPGARPKTEALQANVVALVDILKRQPRAVLLVTAMALPVGFVVVVLVILLGLRSGGVAAEAIGTAAESAGDLIDMPLSKNAPKGKLEAATGKSDALEALAKDYPEDPAVVRELALAYHHERRGETAMATVRALLAMPGAQADAGIARAVIDTALQSGGAEDEAFEILAGPLGARGVDGLVELSDKPSPPSVRKRASKLLARTEVRAKASPAADVLLDFRATKSCKARKELLERVKEHGDARMLDLLTPMKSARGCGFLGTRDCWSCVRKDAALDEALDAVQARVGEP